MEKQSKKEYDKVYNRKNRERKTRLNREYRERHREQLNLAARANRAKKKAEGWHRLRPDYPEPTRPRPKLCECCNNPPGKKSLALDHCHVTGKFRGWLCGKCNTGIGSLGDNISGLHDAVRYLIKAK